MKNLMERLLKRTGSNSPLYRGIILLGSGTALAQLISMGSLPIITRIYVPDEMGLLYTFISIVSILSVASCFGYEPSFSVAKTDRDAINLLVLAFIGLVVFSTVLTLYLMSAGEWSLSIINASELTGYMWLLVVGIFAIGLYRLFNFWAVRDRNYVGITRTKVGQSLAGAFAKISLGFLGMGALGLIIGHVISQFAGVSTLFYSSLKTKTSHFRDASLRGLKSVLSQYKSYPLFNMPASLMNSMAIGLPTIFIIALFDPYSAGQYALATSVMGLPFNFIAQSISQPFLGEASLMIRSKSDGLMSLYWNLTKRLTVMGIALVLPLTILAPFLFPIIFGQSWEIAGWLCVPLALRILPGFIITPTSFGLSIYGFNHWFLLWAFTRLVLMVLGFYVSQILLFDLMQTVFVYGFIMLLSYMMMGIMNIEAIKRCIASY